MPWDRFDEAGDRIDLYATLIGLRRTHSALTGGGMRWLHVDDDVLVYVREDAFESILIVAARADFDVVLDADAIAGVPSATRLFGSATLTTENDGVRLSGAGPVFAVWQLSGTTLFTAL
jgi:alpha-glucosidase